MQVKPIVSPGPRSPDSRILLEDDGFDSLSLERRGSGESRCPGANYNDSRFGQVYYGPFSLAAAGYAGAG